MTDLKVEILPSFNETEVPSVDGKLPPHILICVHGIRDTGAWSNGVAVAAGRFVNRDIIIERIRLPRISSFQFYTQFRVKDIIENAKEQLEVITAEYPENDKSFLGHSFGTKIVLSIIEKDDRFTWAFLAASVCKINEIGKARLLKKGVVNDCSVNDKFPLIAEAIRPSRFQATGVNGFNIFGVKDRFFTYKGHGTCLEENHVRRYIFPVIASGVATSSYIDTGFRKHVAIYGSRGIKLLLSSIIIFATTYFIL